MLHFFCFFYFMKSKNWKLLSIVVLVIVGVFLLSQFKLYYCPLKYIFGVPCVTCGMTRAIECVLRLDFAGAFKWHALWPFVSLAGVLLVLTETGFLKKIRKPVHFFVLIVAICGIIYLVCRLILGDDAIKIDFSQSLIYRIISYLGD